MSDYILVVDDQPAVRLFIREHLEEYGYDLKEADSGLKCLRMATSLDYPSLILLDHSMPAMTGLQVLARLKEDYHAKHIPIIMISADTDLEDVARRLGVRGFLSKPLDLKILLTTVKEVLGDIVKTM